MNISSAWHKSIHQKWSDVKQTDWSVQYKQDHKNQQYFCMRFNIRTMRTSCFDQQHNYNYITACHQSSRTGRFYLEILIFVSSSVIAMDHQFAIILSFSLTPIWWNIDRVEKVLGGILPKNESFFELFDCSFPYFATNVKSTCFVNSKSLPLDTTQGYIRGKHILNPLFSL